MNAFLKYGLINLTIFLFFGPLSLTAQIPMGGGAVKKIGNYYYIEDFAACRRTNWLCNTAFDSVNVISHYNETFLFKKDEKYGMYSSNEYIVIPPSYDSLRYNFSKNIILGKNRGGNWHFLTNLGQSKIDLNCDSIMNIGAGYGIIKNDTINSILALNGDSLGVSCSSYKKINENILFCENFEGSSYYLYNFGGVKLMNYDSVYSFTYYRYKAVVKDGDKMGLMNSYRDEMLLPIIYDSIFKTEDPYNFLTKLDDSLNLVNVRNELIFGGIYNLVYPLKGYFFVIEAEGKYGLIRVNGEVILPVKFDYIGNPSFWPASMIRFIPVRQDNKYALFSYKGDQITDFIFDKVEPRKRYNRNISAYINGEAVKVNFSGEIIR